MAKKRMNGALAKNINEENLQGGKGAYCKFSCVIRMGFEPMTHSLEGCCSIQLSYQTSRFGLIFGWISAKIGCKDSGNWPLFQINGEKSLILFFYLARLSFFAYLCVVKM